GHRLLDQKESRDVPLFGVLRGGALVAHLSNSCGLSRISPANIVSDPSAPDTRAILTRVAAHASAPVSGSVTAARIAIGFAPRLLAYRVNVSCPWPIGIATASSARPG